MTQQEKELMNLIATHDVAINRGFNSLANMEFCEALAKAIIAKYPQILAEKVWSGGARAISEGPLLSLIEHISPEETKIEVFIREVKS